MTYDAIQQELERDDAILTIAKDGPNQICAALHAPLGESMILGAPHSTLPDALNSLNQALKEEQGE